MKQRLLLGCALAAFALSASACSQVAALTGGDSVGKQVLTNLEGCDRHYTGSLGVGVSGSFEITCKAAPPGDPSAIPR